MSVFVCVCVCVCACVCVCMCVCVCVCVCVKVIQWERAIYLFPTVPNQGSDRLGLERLQEGSRGAASHLLRPIKKRFTKR